MRGVGDLFELFFGADVAKGIYKTATKPGIRTIAVGKNVGYKPLDTKATTKISIKDSVKNGKVVKDTVYEVVENPGTKYYPISKTATKPMGFSKQLIIKEVPVAGQLGTVKYSVVEVSDSIATKAKNAIKGVMNKERATVSPGASGPFGMEKEIKAITMTPSNTSKLAVTKPVGKDVVTLPTETDAAFLASLKPKAAAVATAGSPRPTGQIAETSLDQAVVAPEIASVETDFFKQYKDTINELYSLSEEEYEGELTEAFNDMDTKLMDAAAEKAGFSVGYDDAFQGFEAGISDTNMPILEAQRKMSELAKTAGVELEKNPDGMVTLYHGTTKSNGKKILNQGFDDSALFLSPSVENEFSGVNGAGYYGDTIIKAKYDPRDLTFRSEGELYVENGAKAKDVELYDPNASVATAEAEALGVEKIQSAMSGPLKGFSDKPVTADQVTQVMDMAKSKKIPEDAIGTLSSVLNGKGNLNELTQQEAFDLSESIRSIETTKNSSSTDFDFSGINRSQVTQARRWMAAAEQEARLHGKSIPVYSEVWWPMTHGKQVADASMSRFLEKTRDEVWGKYAQDSYTEERRLVTAYRKGDQSAILKNETLDDTTKKELVRIAEWYDKFYDTAAADKVAGTTSEKWLHFYSPEIAKGKGVNIYSKNEDLKSEMKSFYQFEREGSLLPLEDDAMILGEVYANAWYRIKNMKPAYDHAVGLIEKFPTNIRKGSEDYIKESLGMKSDLETDLISIGEKLASRSKGFLPADITQKTLRLLMDNSYVGAMARIDVPLRQSIQIFMNYVDFGSEYATQGFGAFLKDPKASVKYARDNGWLVNQKKYYGSSDQGSFGSGAVGKTLDAYTGLGNKLMTPANAPDTIGRAIAVQSSELRFNENWGKLSSGEISYEEFEKNIDMSSFHPTVQDTIRQKLHGKKEADIIEARDLMTRDIIDRTQFPYRKGETARVQYGLGGKMGLQWTSWTFELANGTRDMIARKDWAKLARFVGFQVNLKRSVEDTYNVDITNWLMNPINLVESQLGPAGKMVTDVIGMMNGAARGYEEEVNANYKDFSNALKLYGGLATGVQAQKFKNYWRSINEYEAGVIQSPDPDKPFRIFSDTGKVKNWVNFWDLTMNAAGFRSVELTEDSEAISRAKEGQIDKQTKYGEAINALVQGDTKGFEKIVTENELDMANLSGRLDSYNTPLKQRVYDDLDAGLKLKYYKLFYPSNE